MPFYYDVARSASVTNGTPLTLTTHLFAQTVANQAPVKIKAIYPNAMGSAAGGGQLRAYWNTGAVATGGAGQTPSVRGDPRTPVALSVWKNDGTPIVAGGTLVNKLIIGFAQTGGQVGWMALVDDDTIEMAANATNPVDFELASIAVAASVSIGFTVEFSEG